MYAPARVHLNGASSLPAAEEAAEVRASYTTAALIFVPAARAAKAERKPGVKAALEVASPGVAALAVPSNPADPAATAGLMLDLH